MVATVQIPAQRRPERDCGVLRVRGDLDAVTLPSLRHELLDVCRRPPCVLQLDLSEVTYMGAAAVGLLQSMSRHLEFEGCRLVIHTRPRQERLFRICGLEHLLAGSGSK